MLTKNTYRSISLTRVCVFFLAIVAVIVMAQSAVPFQKDKKVCLTECQPRIGIASAFGSEADILLVKTTEKKQYSINGNLFTAGKLNGNRIVIVLTGMSVENAAMITQVMIDHFNIHHLIFSGIAGGVNPDYRIGDVVIPAQWSLPLEGYWNEDSNLPSPCNVAGDLSCLDMKLASFTSQPRSDYQVLKATEKVGTGLFMRENFIKSAAHPKGEFKFDYPADPKMLELARRINPQLQRCGPKNPKLCISNQPVIRIGGRGATIPTFLDNANYRSYLDQTLQAVSADMETAAFAHVAYANAIPFIAFRSLSDLAGGTNFKDTEAFFASGLAETNEASVTLSFLSAWAQSK